MQELPDLRAGLRCNDVHSGLRNVDPNSPNVAPLSEMRTYGMAASVAALIRGQDVVQDAESLKTIVAEQLDISPYAFGPVIDLLERAGFVEDVQRRGTRIVSFNENIPFYEDLYESLGGQWRNSSPSQLEQEMLSLIDRLAAAPLPADSLEQEIGLDKSDVGRLLELGKSSDLVKSANLIDGEILYSPFYGFENPDLVVEIFSQHGSGQLAEELTQLRSYQGLPLDEQQYPALADAIGRGFIMAPSVTRPDKVEQPFAALPYLPDARLLTVRKTVLEKALAVVACVRCGQHFGGVTSTKSPARVLNALLDPSRGYQIGAHSSHQRQYQLLYRLQVVDFVPSGSWVAPKLIPTADNLEAVRIARDLVAYGEPIEDRAVGSEEARALLSLNSPYQAPMQTVHRRRDRILLSDRDYRSVLDVAMGRRAL